MQQEITYCEKCGQRIPWHEVAEGTALVTNRGAVCPRCEERLSPGDWDRLLRRKEIDGDDPSRDGRASAGGARKAAGGEWTRRRVAFVVAGAVAGWIVLAVLIALMVSLGGDEPQAPPSADIAAADVGRPLPPVERMPSSPPVTPPSEPSEPDDPPPERVFARPAGEEAADGRQETAPDEGHVAEVEAADEASREVDEVLAHARALSDEGRCGEASAALTQALDRLDGGDRLDGSDRLAERDRARLLAEFKAVNLAMERALAANSEALIGEAEALLRAGRTADARTRLDTAPDRDAWPGKARSRAATLIREIEKAEEEAGAVPAEETGAAAGKGTKKAETGVARILSRFDELVDRGEYASAAGLVTTAAGMRRHAAHAATLRAAGRVARELERRRECIRAAAKGIAGRRITARTTKGLRSGEAGRVTDAGLDLVSRTIINGQIRGVRFYLVRWDDLPPALVDELAAGWKPKGADGEVAKMLVAVSRGDPDAATKALAAAGDHPLAIRMRGRAAPLAAAAAATKDTAASPDSAAPLPAEGTWPPPREFIAGLFRGKLLKYRPESLEVKLFYDFEETDQGLDWWLTGSRSGRGGLDVRDGVFSTTAVARPPADGAHDRTSAFLEAVFTSVAVRVEVRAGARGRPSGGVLVCGSLDGRSYGLSGMPIREVFQLTKRLRPGTRTTVRTVKSPFGPPGRGSLVFTHNAGQLTGWVGWNSLRMTDRTFPSGRVGLWGRDGEVAFDDLHVEGKLDPKWLEGLLAVRRMGAPRDAVEFGGHWYRMFHAQLTWPGARRACEDAGGHLVTIGSREESEFIQFLVPRWRPYGWIGLTDEREEGSWEWVTGEPVGFTAWLEGDPPAGGDPDGGDAENAASIFTVRGVWRDFAADETMGYVCEWEPAGKP